MPKGKIKITKPSDACPFNYCDGSGWIWWKDYSLQFQKVKDYRKSLPKDEWMEECECLKQKELQRKIRLSHVPENFRDAKINNFNIDVYVKSESKDAAMVAKEAAKNFVWFYSDFKKKGKGLYFYSKTKGSGKTRIISSIANAITAQYKNEQVLYIHANNLLEEIKSKFGNKDDVTSQDIIQIFSKTDLLIIDDLGVEMLSDSSGWIERTMTTIINSRLEAKRVTIFSSNYRINELNSVYKQGRIQSRIAEMAIEIQMPEEDVRTKLAQENNEEMEYLLFLGGEK